MEQPSTRANTARFLRNSAALLITATGITLIAALWARALDDAALLDALLGAVYLFIGIGLFGHSRFTLFVAMAVPAGSIALMPHTGGPAGLLHPLRVLAELLVIVCCARVLWQSSRRPGDSLGP